MKKVRLLLGVVAALALSAGLWWLQNPEQVSLPQVSEGQFGRDSSLGETGVERRPDYAQSPAAVVPSSEIASIEKSIKEQNVNSHDHKAVEIPSQATIEAVRQLGSSADSGGQPVNMPDGSVQVQLGNRFRSVPVATVGKDGEVHVDYHGEKYMQDKPVESKP